MLGPEVSLVTVDLRNAGFADGGLKGTDDVQSGGPRGARLVRAWLSRCYGVARTNKAMCSVYARFFGLGCDSLVAASVFDISVSIATIIARPFSME